MKTVLAIYWIKGKIFFAKNNDMYLVTNLRYPYIYARYLMCRLDWKNDYMHFKYVWVPIIHIVVTRVPCFNWAFILAYAMHKVIGKPKSHYSKRNPAFYMAFYLLIYYMCKQLFPIITLQLDCCWKPTPCLSPKPLGE